MTNYLPSTCRLPRHYITALARFTASETTLQHCRYTVYKAGNAKVQLPNNQQIHQVFGYLQQHALVPGTVLPMVWNY